jgi:hypothetical protein
VKQTVKVPINFKIAPRRGVGSLEKRAIDTDPIRELIKNPTGP